MESFRALRALYRDIGSLSDEVRDRIICETRWCRRVWVMASGERCYAGVRDNLEIHRGHYYSDGTPATISCDNEVCAFDRLTGRYGIERIVRLLKRRAARRNRVDLPEPTEATGPSVPALPDGDTVEVGA